MKVVKIGERTFSPIRYERLLISWCIVFAILTIILFLVPLPTWAMEIMIQGRGLLIGTGIAAIMAIPLGWYLYKRYFHCVFSYGETSFTFKKGGGCLLEGRWSDFTQVSLVRSGYEFNIRLYKDDEEYVELPVSKVKLNPYDFRSKVAEFISGGRGKG